MTPEERVGDYLKFGGRPGGPGAMGTAEADAYYQGRLDQARKDVQAVVEEREACAELADLYRSEEGQGLLLHISGESAKTIWEVGIGSVAAAIRARTTGEQAVQCPTARSGARPAEGGEEVQT